MKYTRNGKIYIPDATEMKKLIRESAAQFYVNTFGNIDKIANFLENYITLWHWKRNRKLKKAILALKKLIWQTFPPPDHLPPTTLVLDDFSSEFYQIFKEKIIIISSYRQ